MQRGRRVVVAAAVLVAAVLATGIAGAKVLPAPGTPAEIAALVASSHKIERVPSNLVPSLADVGSDNAAVWGYWKIKSGCSSATQCVYGDRAATNTVVLFGDSHAAMWLPSIDWVGRHLGFRVVLLWMAGCPAANVSVLNPNGHLVDTACNAFRRSSLKLVQGLAPSLVLTANRTANVVGANGRLVPGSAWQAGLAATLSTLLADKLKVAVIGDVSPLSSPAAQCLASYPTTVQQRCSSPNPNPGLHTQLKAEVAAARAEGVPYLNPVPWLCTKVCSPIVGRYAAYYDWQHVAATYAAYLSLDWEGTLKPLLAG